jgi:diguanylate cyclase (GGDEF)-like protein/PAS domain S-box-containing protein
MPFAAVVTLSILIAVLLLAVGFRLGMRRALGHDAGLKRFRFMVENASQEVWLAHLDGRLAYANPAACASLGYSQSEIVGMHMADVDPEGAKRFADLVESIRRQALPPFVTRHRRRDGQTLPKQVSAAYLEVDGEAYICGFAQDISERQQAEQVLREEREKLRFILDLAPIGIWMQDGTGQMSFVNKAFCESMGIPESAFLAVPHYAELIPADFRNQCLASDVKALASGGVSDNVQQLPFVDGRIHDLRVIKSVKRDAEGKPLALIGLSLDITEERAQQQALRASEVKFHTMLDWTHDVEYWLDPDGSFQYLTPSVERLTGYPPSAFIESPELINRIVHAGDKALWDAHRQFFHASGASAAVRELDLRIVRQDGKTLWVAHTCRQVFDADGNNLGLRVTLRDINARKVAEEQVRSLAYFDPLTRLPNRRLLMDRLGHALVAAQRSREYGALMILDLDHFKALNDTRGHDIGDLLLIEVAQRMQAGVRQEDTVARLGGDEYVVVLEGLGTNEAAAAQQAEAVAEKVRAALADPYRLVGLEQEHHSAASIGLTLFGGDIAAGQSADSILKQADVALYQAKDAGRNAVRFFNPAMQAAIDAHAAMESALRRGLNQGELQLYYQPQVNQHGALIGAEALLRWLPPDREPVPPARFIPLAEATGLILPIGKWVFDTAFAELKTWESQPGKSGLRLAVNVSARQFHQSDFVRVICDSLARSGADPTRLKLELTESAVLANVDESIHRMHELRRMGITFSLDDFGTGYSSLAYLKRLPLDQVKIDQSFVRDLSHDPNDAAIVRAILAMSHSLSLDVIAEGVETEAQRSFLIDNGCTDFQGYLFGKPLPMQQWES